MIKTINYQIIEPIKSRMPSTEDLIMAMMVDCGCEIGSFPRNLEHHPISDDWEYLNLCEMKEDEKSKLPNHWKKLIPRLEKEAKEWRYAYVNVPTEIIVKYPKVPVTGVCVVDSNIKPEDITASDLIWIGDELE